MLLHKVQEKKKWPRTVGEGVHSGPHWPIDYIIIGQKIDVIVSNGTPYEGQMGPPYNMQVGLLYYIIVCKGPILKDQNGCLTMGKGTIGKQKGLPYNGYMGLSYNASRDLLYNEHFEEPVLQGS